MEKKVRIDVIATYAAILGVTVVVALLMGAMSIPFPGRYQIQGTPSNTVVIRCDTWTGRTEIGTPGQAWLPVGESTPPPAQ